MADPGLRPLAERLQEICLAAGLTVATAESCTGGRIADALTDVAGSSFDEQDSPADPSPEGSTDGQPATEHLNGNGPGPGSTAADHSGQDERTAD